MGKRRFGGSSTTALGRRPLSITLRGAGQRSAALIGIMRSSGDTRPFESVGHLVKLVLPPLVSAAEAGPRDDHVPAVAATGAGSSRVRSAATTRGPLLVILGVQVILSARLIWTNTAFQDEALYLRAGRLEWARWLHHVPIPDFPAYFSGAPVLYPPLGALADSVGGLIAARLASLVLMLGVSSLLWATAAKLYGRRTALLATGLFATLAGTQFLGAFATFDAMALFLLSLSVWLGVRAVDHESGMRIVLLVAAGTALAAANATTYATALFTPVAILVITYAARRRRDGTNWLTVLLAVSCTWLTLVGAGIKAGGRDYWLGITTSTLTRASSDTPATAVLRDAYTWSSLIGVLAVLGAVLASRSEARGKLLPAVLAAAALLAPVEQARLHTTVSLQKHVVFGAWFAAIAAGYAMARLSRVDRGRGWAAVMALPIAASTLFGSMGQSTSLYGTWPNATAVISVLRSAIRSHPGHYLAEDYDVEAYYLASQASWQRWSSTYSFTYGQSLPGAPSYRAAIDSHYFSLVILDYGDTAATDSQLTTDMQQAGRYYILTRAGSFTIWAAHAPVPLSRGGS